MKIYLGIEISSEILNKFVAEYQPLLNELELIPFHRRGHMGLEMYFCKFDEMYYGFAHEMLEGEWDLRNKIAILSYISHQYIYCADIIQWILPA